MAGDRGPDLAHTPERGLESDFRSILETSITQLMHKSAGHALQRLAWCTWAVHGYTGHLAHVCAHTHIGIHMYTYVHSQSHVLLSCS